MPRTRFSPPGVFSPGTFSHYAVAERSTHVFFAGQVPVDADGRLVGRDDLYLQTVAAMRNVEILIADAGVTWADIVRRTIYTTRPHELGALTRGIAEVTGEVAGEVPGPPQSVVGVTGLALPQFLVEVECTAVVR